jgi:hypothetical protein
MNTGVLEILTALSVDGGNPALGEITKALTTQGAGTDLSALTGGGAFRVENMDATLASATVRQEHFKFFRRLLPNRRESWSVLDQAVVKNGIGAFFGSATSNELGSGQTERNGDYSRVITELGTFFSRRSVSVITALQATLQAKNGVVDFSAVDQEDVNAALEILYTLEYSLFYGDRTNNPQDINGVVTQVYANASQNVKDLAGQPLKSHNPVSALANNITDTQNFGAPTLLFMSGKVKGDLDAYLESGYRVNLDSGVPATQVGVLVKGMRYSSVAVADGTIDFDPHFVLNEDAKKPVQATNAAYCTLGAPATLTAAFATGATGSLWTDAPGGSDYAFTVDGNYYYGVEACNAGGVSTLKILSSAVAVTANGGKVTLSIGASSGNAETFYKVYRGRKGGTNAVSDFRYIGQVVKDVSGTTTYVDLNATIPGSSEAVLLTMAPESIRWIQMLPMAKIPFAINDLSYKWGAFLVGALRTALPKHHGVIRNIIPTTATWKAFT